MINAKEEFLRHFREVGTWRGVKCASVEYKDLTFGLKQNFEVGDFSTFLKELDFEYDNSWGIQELYGTIWFNDGTWSERAEYDGSEWWEHRVCPEIPESLKGKV